MSDGARSLAQAAMAREQALAYRRNAISALLNTAPDVAEEVLFKIGEDGNEDPELLRLAGRELARISTVGGEFSEFALRNLTEISYGEFCEYSVGHPDDSCAEQCGGEATT